MEIMRILQILLKWVKCTGFILRLLPRKAFLKIVAKDSLWEDLIGISRTTERTVHWSITNFLSGKLVRTCSLVLLFNQTRRKILFVLFETTRCVWRFVWYEPHKVEYINIYTVVPTTRDPLMRDRLVLWDRPLSAPNSIFCTFCTPIWDRTPTWDRPVTAEGAVFRRRDQCIP